MSDNKTKKTSGGKLVKRPNIKPVSVLEEEDIVRSSDDESPVKQSSDIESPKSDKSIPAKSSLPINIPAKSEVEELKAQVAHLQLQLKKTKRDDTKKVFRIQMKYTTCSKCNGEPITNIVEEDGTKSGYICMGCRGSGIHYLGKFPSKKPKQLPFTREEHDFDKFAPINPVRGRGRGFGRGQYPSYVPAYQPNYNHGFNPDLH